MNTNLNVNYVGATYAGSINGQIKVYIAPYSVTDYIAVVFRGASSYDAGMLSVLLRC